MTIPDTYFNTRLVAPSAYAPPTLTRYLGEYLRIAEELFGVRNKDFTILGIEILEDEGTTPHTWYPPSSPEHKHIIVHLSQGALNSLEQAQWQLAHECIHLLDPHIPVKEPTSNLEEGVATWFQNTYVSSRFSSVCDAYTRPGELVSIIQKHCPTAIRTLRKHEGVVLAYPGADRLRDSCPVLSVEEAEFLCKRFKSN